MFITPSWKMFVGFGLVVGWCAMVTAASAAETTAGNTVPTIRFRNPKSTPTTTTSPTCPKKAAATDTHATAPRGGTPSSAARFKTPGEVPKTASRVAPRVLSRNAMTRVPEEDPASASRDASTPIGHRPDTELDVQPTAFKGIQLGKTNLDGLLKAWGKPATESSVTDDTNQAILTLTYPFEPFDRVEANIRRDTKIVTQIVIYLKEPLPTVNVIKQLGLSEVRPVPLPSSVGVLIGQAYPERGVMLRFSPRKKGAAPLVAEIHVEAIHDKYFVLRARYDFQRDYSRDLVDLDYALGLNPMNADAHALKAKVLLETGYYHRAMEDASAAVDMAPTPQHQLIKVRLLTRLGSREKAISLVQQVLASEKRLPPHVQAEGEYLLGQLLATGKSPDYRKAINRYRRAIQLATPLVNDPRFTIRREAKLLLAKANLAVAHSIVAGPWKKRAEVANQWIGRADAVVEGLVRHDQGDAALRLEVWHAKLIADAIQQKPIGPSTMVDAAIQEGRRIIAQSPDPLYQHRIEWKLGELLADAMRVEKLQGRFEQAIRYSELALPLLKENATVRPLSDEERYRLGRFYFLAGSLCALDKKDHQRAVRWFDRAAPLLAGPMPHNLIVNTGVVGEWNISMGVSYWQIGEKQAGLRLTEQGTKLVEQAVRKGIAKQTALAVPYGNLAAMYAKTGHQEKAAHYSDLAKRLRPQQPNEETTRRR